MHARIVTHLCMEPSQCMEWVLQEILLDHGSLSQRDSTLVGSRTGDEETQLPCLFCEPFYYTGPIDPFVQHEKIPISRIWSMRMVFLFRTISSTSVISRLIFMSSIVDRVSLYSSFNIDGQKGFSFLTLTTTFIHLHVSKQVQLGFVDYLLQALEGPYMLSGLKFLTYTLLLLLSKIQPKKVTDLEVTSNPISIMAHFILLLGSLLLLLHLTMHFLDNRWALAKSRCIGDRFWVPCMSFRIHISGCGHECGLISKTNFCIMLAVMRSTF